ncbi:MAG: hypothetical protein HYV97_03685 [Bdellovibrio sp.]|nr:hypothetical protein [Bdellovibrio sp.]
MKASKIFITIFISLISFITFAEEAAPTPSRVVLERKAAILLELLENAESIQMKDGTVIEFRDLELQKGFGDKLDSMKGMMIEKRSDGGTGAGG